MTSLPLSSDLFKVCPESKWNIQSKCETLIYHITIRDKGDKEPTSNPRQEQSNTSRTITVAII